MIQACSCSSFCGPLSATPFLSCSRYRAVVLRSSVFNFDKASINEVIWDDSGASEFKERSCDEGEKLVSSEVIKPLILLHLALDHFSFILEKSLRSSAGITIITITDNFHQSVENRLAFFGGLFSNNIRSPFQGLSALTSSRATDLSLGDEFLGKGGLLFPTFGGPRAAHTLPW